MFVTASDARARRRCELLERRASGWLFVRLDEHADDDGAADAEKSFRSNEITEFDASGQVIPKKSSGKKKPKLEPKPEPKVEPEVESKVEPEVKPVETTINIRLTDQTGEQTFFKVKKTTQLFKVFNAYGQRKGVDPTLLRYFFDGVRAHEHQTLVDLDMDDGDQIDVKPQQSGC